MESMFYVVNMRGLKPTYYTIEDRQKAFNVYSYLYSMVTSNVSIRRVSWKKVIKDGICRGLN